MAHECDCSAGVIIDIKNSKIIMKIVFLCNIKVSFTLLALSEARLSQLLTKEIVARLLFSKVTKTFWDC